MSKPNVGDSVTRRSMKSRGRSINHVASFSLTVSGIQWQKLWTMMQKMAKPRINSDSLRDRSSEKGLRLWDIKSKCL